MKIPIQPTKPKFSHRLSNSNNSLENKVIGYCYFHGSDDFIGFTAGIVFFYLFLYPWFLFLSLFVLVSQYSLNLAIFFHPFYYESLTIFFILFRVILIFLFMFLTHITIFLADLWANFWNFKTWEFSSALGEYFISVDEKPRQSPLGLRRKIFKSVIFNWCTHCSCCNYFIYSLLLIKNIHE